jgi:hypothetical protein
MLGSAERLCSHEAGLLAVGSDPTEWWDCFDAVIGAYRAAASKGGRAIEVDDLRAYREGTVSWVADRVVLKMPNAVEVPCVTPSSSIKRTANGRSFTHTTQLA